MFLFCFAAAILIAASNVNAEQNPPNAQSDTVDSKIYLKDITTGVKVDRRYFTEFRNLSTGGYYAQYQYFGAAQSIAISTDKSGSVYSYLMLFKGSIDELRVALEEKFTKTNNRPIKFHCFKTTRGFGLDIVEGMECTLRHQSQRLILMRHAFKKNPKKQDSQVHLIDDDLARLANIEEREAEEKIRTQQKKKAKDDI
jgi:hypothetical protein